MRVTYLFTGPEGQSHFADREVIVSRSVLGATSPPLPALSVSLRDTEGGPLSVGFRPAPRRQLVILLRGKVEYCCGDGSRRVLGAGDILLADDTEGQGHRAHVVESPRVQVFVPIAPEADLQEWLAPLDEASAGEFHKYGEES
jgi:hypothetical protein